MRPAGFAATAIAAALLAAPAPSPAQDAGQTPPRDRAIERMMGLLDTDGDGRIGAAEVAAEQQRLLRAADLDGDGKLSAAEFKRRGRWFLSMRTTSLFDLMDGDGDQLLTLEEIGAPSRRWLKRYDANGDGAIEASELPRRPGQRKRRR